MEVSAQVSTINEVEVSGGSDVQHCVCVGAGWLSACCLSCGKLAVRSSACSWFASRLLDTPSASSLPQVRLGCWPSTKEFRQFTFQNNTTWQECKGSKLWLWTSMLKFEMLNCCVICNFDESPLFSSQAQLIPAPLHSNTRSPQTLRHLHRSPLPTETTKKP